MSDSLAVHGRDRARIRLKEFMRALFWRCVIALLLFESAVGIGSAQTAGKQESDDADAGKVIFEAHCALCHGLNGGGGRGPDLRRPTFNHASDDEGLRALIQNGIPPEMPDAWYLNKQDVRNVAAFVRRLGTLPKEPVPGDPVRGEAVYERSGCSSCHILRGRGVGIGPELSAVGARRGAARLHETLLDPSKTLPDGFLQVEVLTATGERIRAIRLNEDSFTIQMKDLQNRIYSFRKSGLRELKKLRGETPMPSYAGTFTESDLEDVVAFLASQRGQQ